MQTERTTRLTIRADDDCWTARGDAEEIARRLQRQAPVPTNRGALVLPMGTRFVVRCAAELA